MFKKFLLLLTFFLLPIVAHATTYYGCTENSGVSWNSTTGAYWVTSTGAQAACTSPVVAGTANTLILNSSSGTGTWTVTGSFSETAITMTGFPGTLTGTSQTLTTTGLLTLGGTITGSITFATTTGGVTLGSSLGASTDAITVGGAETLTSAGYTWGGTMTFSGASTDTFTASSTWESTGLCTISNTVLLTPLTATLKCDGGFTITSAMNASSVAIINWAGGTLTDASYAYTLYGPLVIGSTNIGSNQYISYGGSSITLTTGATITGNSLIVPNGNLTITSNSATFSGSIALTNSQTLTLVGNLVLGGSFVSDKGNNIMAGSYNITAPYFEFSAGRNNAGSLTLVSGTTLTVTTAMYVYGFITNLSSMGGISHSSYINATTPGSAAHLTFSGSAGNSYVGGIVFTDINASGSTGGGIYNYGGSTVSGTSGITNVNATNLGGGSSTTSRGYTYGS